MKTKTYFKYCILSFVIFILCFCVFGCNNANIDDSDTTQMTDSESQDIDTSVDTSTDTDGVEEEQGYFVATVSENGLIIPSFYTDGKEVPEHLKGIYYSADSPGGKPRNDGTGKIYLYIKPIKTYSVVKVVVDGEYSSVENLGRDLYCIHGVKSDLRIDVNTSTLIGTQNEYFDSYGYGITDDGKMVVNWKENEIISLFKIVEHYKLNNKPVLKAFEK